MTEKKTKNAMNEKGLVPGAPEAAKEILSLSGSVALNRILTLENPEAVRSKHGPCGSLLGRQKDR